MPTDRPAQRDAVGPLLVGSPAWRAVLTEPWVQLMKEVLDPAGLMISIMRRHVAGVPHSVHLPTRLGDVPNGADYGLTIPRSKADFSLRDDRVLVLAGVEMGRNKSTDRATRSQRSVQRPTRPRRR
jgi:hypothetical protein